MKKIFLLATSVLFVIIVNAQTTRRTGVQDAHDKYANQEVEYATTTKLPKGTGYKNGKIVLKKGYKTSYADNNQVIVVQKANGGVTGAFSCACKEGTGSCRVFIRNEIMSCLGDGCTCVLNVSVGPQSGIAITKSTINWKKLVIKNRQVAEDPDQGGEIIKSKQDVLPSKQ